MRNEPGARQDLERKIKRFWKRHGYEAERVEVGEVPLQDQGTVLCANFLPTADNANVNRATDEMVRLLLVFLVSKGHSKAHVGVQSAVNVRAEGSDPERFLVSCKYWSDKERLRALEGMKRRPLEALSIDALISGKHEVVPQQESETGEASNGALPLPR